MTPQSIPSGSSANLTLNAFQKAGWTFAGWATSSTGAKAYNDGASYTMGTTGITLYALWTANSLTVTFNKNDAAATGNMTPQSIPSGSSANLTLNAFQKAGWTFAGWATSSTGAKAYNEGASYTMGTTGVTLYALWTANSLTVTFNKNDAAATGNMTPQSIPSGSSANLALNAFQKLGWTFAGWATSSTGAKAYNDGASYTMGTTGVTLYALWAVNSFTITFDKNDAAATGTMTPQSIASGASAALTVNEFAKAGYTFAGWATTASGAVAYADGASYTMGAANVTLWAKWSVKDADGNVYTTVTMGSQTWMVENFRCTHYNDNSPIPLVTDSVIWQSQGYSGVAQFCYYNNTTNSANITKFGALYNYYAINATNFAPSGWHVPTDADWAILQSYLISSGYNWDGSKTGDNKIAKSLAAKTDWSASSTAGTPGNSMSTNNTSGFTALPGGYREGDTYVDMGAYGYWWTKTETAPSSNSNPGIQFDNEQLLTRGIWLGSGCSVRLVRDY